MISITPIALSKALRHALSSPEKEVIGLLVGKLQNGELFITDAIPAPHKYATTVSVSLLDEFQAEVAEKLLKEGGDKYIVGIYHSHPGFGCFLSDTDISTQQRIQQMFPQAVAMVIDPLQPGNVNYKFFRVSGGEAIEIPSRVVDLGFPHVHDHYTPEIASNIQTPKKDLRYYLPILSIAISLAAIIVSAFALYFAFDHGANSGESGSILPLENNNSNPDIQISIKDNPATLSSNSSDFLFDVWYREGKSLDCEEIELQVINYSHTYVLKWDEEGKIFKGDLLIAVGDKDSLHDSNISPGDKLTLRENGSDIFNSPTTLEFKIVYLSRNQTVYKGTVDLF